MIFFGYYNLDRRENGSSFTCSVCQAEARFFMRRTYRYFHICFIPLRRLELVSEAVECGACGAAQPVTVLASKAEAVSSAFLAGSDAGAAISENLGNVVTLTEAAVAEILRRHRAGGWTTEAAIRVTRDEAGDYVLTFDYPLTDGRDWIGQSHHIPLLVDRRDAPLLLGKMIDFRDGQFCDALRD